MAKAASATFIVVSNRLPVNVSRQNGRLVFAPSSGGLATAMSSLREKVGDMVWIGWPGIASDDLSAAEKRQITQQLARYGCYPVFLSAQQVHNFYEGYANDTLWPLFHYFKSKAKYSVDYWQAYQAVNEVFRLATTRLAAPNATIWVHDYQLMLLPASLRARLPAARIGFFLHIPFPSFELYRLLPNRKDLLRGLLGADLVGFHVYDYAQHFISSARRVLGYESDHGTIVTPGRTVKADVFPIGIDYDKFVAALSSEDVQHELHVLEDRYPNQRVILSVDRLDYSKGIAQRLHAYETFLRTYPQWHKKVTLVMIAVPSRTEVHTYQELRDEIEQAVSRINGMYGTLDWAPIAYQFQNLPFPDIVALYARADVALVTPLRDGMNLVAKEFVACKQKRPGVLILSEMAGAADELLEALQVNPNNNEAIVEALRKALVMPKTQQRRRLLSMQKRIKSYTVQHWAADFVRQLTHASRTHTIHRAKRLDDAIQQQLCSEFHTAKRRLLILDYDGTLQKFTTSPLASASMPSRPLKRILGELLTVPGVDIVIISGRSREALDSWFGKTKLTLVAEHGALVKYKGEWYQREAAFRTHKKKVIEIMERYAERTPGSRVEEKEFGVVWHYRGAPPELAYARSANLRHELRNVLAHTDVGVFGGSKIVEVKSQNITKGNAVTELLAYGPYDFILCAGDDYTDEDMFAALPEGAHSIKVGLGATHAQFQLETVDDVLRLLKQLRQQPKHRQKPHKPS